MKNYQDLSDCQTEENQTINEEDSDRSNIGKKKGRSQLLHLSAMCLSTIFLYLNKAKTHWEGQTTQMVLKKLRIQIVSSLEIFREHLTELGAGRLGIDLLTVWLVVSVVLTLATCLSIVLVMTPVSLVMIVSFVLMVVVSIIICIIPLGGLLLLPAIMFAMLAAVLYVIFN